MTQQADENRKAYDIKRGNVARAEYKKWLKERPPEVVLGHRLESVLHKAIMRTRGMGKSSCPKCRKKFAVRNMENIFNGLYKEVTALLTKRVMHNG